MYLILISLLAQFDLLKINYNILSEKLTLNELIAYCAQEEEILNKKG